MHLTAIPTLAVAALHGYILVLESFLWTHPLGRKTFGHSPAFAEQTRVLGANQGLYNGFLAAGLTWGALHGNQTFGREIKLFFLGCVAVAGIVGGLTAKPKIFFVQAVPALVVGALVWWL